MPWKQKKIEEYWVLWTVWNSEVIVQMRLPLLLPLHASFSKTLSNLSFDLVISKSLLPWQNVRCKYAFTALNIKHLQGQYLYIILRFVSTHSLRCVSGSFCRYCYFSQKQSHIIKSLYNKTFRSQMKICVKTSEKKSSSSVNMIIFNYTGRNSSKLNFRQHLKVNTLRGQEGRRTMIK